MAKTNSPNDSQRVPQGAPRIDRRAFTALGLVTGMAYILPARSQATLPARQVDCDTYPRNLRFFENVLPADDPYKRILALFGDLTIKEIFEDDIVVLEPKMQNNLTYADWEIFPNKVKTKQNLTRFKDSIKGASNSHRRTLKYLIRQRRANWRPSSAKIVDALNYLEQDLVFLPPQLIPDSAKGSEKNLLNGGFVRRFGSFKLRDFFCLPKSHIIKGSSSSKAAAEKQIADAKKVGVFRVYPGTYPFGMHELSPSTKNGYACDSSVPECVPQQNGYCEMVGNECNAMGDPFP